MAILCPLIFPPCLIVDVPGFGVKAAVGQAVCSSLCEKAFEVNVYYKYIIITIAEHILIVII